VRHLDVLILRIVMNEVLQMVAAEAGASRSQLSWHTALRE
jgi:hypothetical protein